MAVMMSKEALKAMEEALAANQDAANPFVREGETTFIRHDEVRVIQRCPGLIAIEFRWRGTLTHTMYADCRSFYKASLSSRTLFCELRAVLATTSTLNSGAAPAFS